MEEIMEHDPSKGYISYQKKGNNLYAIHSRSYRKGKTICHNNVYIGRVIDKDNNIFKNQARGTFKYTIEEGYTTTLSETIKQLDYNNINEILAIDFGDAWLFAEIIKSTGLEQMLKEGIDEKYYNIFLTMLAYKLLDSEAYQYAHEWQQSSLIKFIYPDVSIKSQRVSKFLELIGSEYCFRKLLKAYLNYISKISIKHPILIDSTGLPNDIKFDLTAVNNHNGVISNEMRLILVLDRVNGLPIYFRYVAGNIVDVTTLQTTILELEAYGINIEHLIIDAGYYSDKNLSNLHNLKIPYIIRMCSNRKIYKQIVKDNIDNLEDIKNYVIYRDRHLYCKVIKTKISNSECYAYLFIDLARQFEETKRYLTNYGNDIKISDTEKQESLKTKGIFIIVSTIKIEISSILPLYYTRQKIEQTFDLGKNNANLLPLRVHNQKILRGHLLLSFISTIIYIILNNKLDKSNYSAHSAFHLFRSLKAKVFSNSVIINEPNKRMNDIIRCLKLELPNTLNINEYDNNKSIIY
jgi:hypothetical protein